MGRISIVAGVIAALAAPVLVAHADIWKEDPSKKKSKPSVKWRTDAGDPKRDLKVEIDPNAPADFKADVKAAMQNWNNAGTAWALEPTITVNQSPLMISAILDEGVDVHMAYNGPGVPNLKTVYLTRYGGEWTEFVLDADTGVGSALGTSIGLSATHTPCVSYLGTTGGRQELRVACIGVRCEGDVNCDGVINALDIEAFILALFDPDEYMNRYPDCDILLADMNGDGLVNAQDIAGFIDALFA